MRQNPRETGESPPNEGCEDGRGQILASMSVRPKGRASSDAERLAWHVRVIEVLAKVSEKVAVSSDPLQPLWLLVDELTRLLGNHAAAVFRFEPEGRLLRLVCGRVDGRTSDELPGHPYGRADLPMPVDEFPAWPQLIDSGRAEFFWIPLESTAPPSNEWHAHHHHRYIVISALMAQGKPLGFLGLAFQHDVAPDSAQLEAFSVLAQQVTLILQQTELAETVRRDAVARAIQKSEATRAERIAETHEVIRSNAAALAAQTDLAELLPQVMRAVARQLGAPGCSLFLRNEATRTLDLHSMLRGDTVWTVPPPLGGHQFKRTYPIADRFVSTPRTEPLFVADVVRGNEAIDAATAEWMRLDGQVSHLRLPLFSGQRRIGTLVVHKGDAQPFAPEDVDLAFSLAHQAALALEIRRAADIERSNELMRERERAAAARAAELERASDALQRTIDALQGLDDVENIVPRVLNIVAEAFGSEDCAVFDNEPSGRVRLKYWHAGGRTMTPSQFIDSGRLTPETASLVKTLASGFTVPDSYLGAASTLAVGTFVLNHRLGTSVPEFDVFAIDNHLDVELNIGVGVQGVRRVTLCVYRPLESPFTDSERALAESLAKQMGLAMVMAKFAQEARESALLREREQAAEARAAELNRASLALQQTIDAVSQLQSLDDFVPRALRIAAEVFGAESAGYFEHHESQIYLRFWFVDGQVFGPDELPGLASSAYGVISELANGFVVPIGHLGVDPFHRDRPSIIDHATATASPHLHRFCMSLGWAWELNVPLLIGGQAEGAITLYRSISLPFTEDDFALATGLAKQVSLAMKISAVAEREREIAVARERAAELARANEALRRSVSRLAESPDVAAALEQALRTAIEVIGAEGGAIARYFPAERGFRNLYQVYGDEFQQAHGQGENERLYSLEEPAIAAAWNAFNGSDGVLWCNQDSPFLTDDTLAFMRQMGMTAVVLAPLKRGADCIGYLGLLHSNQPLQKEQSELLRALSDQIALMLELQSLADSDKEAAVLREQQRLALARANELERAGSALQRTIDAVAELESLGDFVPRALRIVSEAFGASSAGFFEHPGATIYLRYWLLDGEIYGPKELPQLDVDRYAVMLRLAQGFTVPQEHLGVDLHQRFLPSIIHHATATASPELHEFCVRMGWEWELNVPLVIGRRAEGAITLFRPQGKPFTEADFGLAEALAKQMALAMKMSGLAEHEREVVVARERADELARANVAMRNTLAGLAQEHDPRALMGVVLKEVVKQLEGSAGQLVVYDQQHDTLTQLALVDQGELVPGDRDFPHVIPASALDALPLIRASEGPRFFDVSTESHLFWPGSVEFHRQRGYRSVYVVPLRFGGEFAGFLGCAARVFQPLSRARGELILSLSQQATLAAELIRRSDATRLAAVMREREHAALERASQLTAANQALARAVSTISEAPVDEAPGLVLMEFARAAGAEVCDWLAFDPGRRTLEVAIRIRNNIQLTVCPESDPELFRTPFSADVTPAFDYLSENDAFIKMSTHGDSPMIWPGVKEWHALAGRIESIAFAVRVGDELLGIIGMGFVDRVAITDADEQVLRSLANQFALALQMTRLAEVSREAETARAVASEREQATREQLVELERANAAMSRTISTLNRENSVDAFLATTMKTLADTLEIPSVAMWLHRDEAMELHLVYENGGIVAGAKSGHPNAGKPIPTAGTRFAHIGDTSSRRFPLISRLLEDNFGTKQQVDYLRAQGVRALIESVMMVDQRILGKFTARLVDGQPDPSPARLALVQALTNQAALALEMTRLADEARMIAVIRDRERAAVERTRELTRANDALKRGVARLSEDVDLGDFLGQVLAEAERQVGATSNVIFLHDDATGTLALRRQHVAGIADSAAEQTRLSEVPACADDIPLWARVREGWVVSHDVADLGACLRLVLPAASGAPMTVLAVPLSVGGRVIGFMAPAFARRVDISAEHVELVQALAHQATLALELTRLSQVARDAAAAQAASDERGRIAGEIHDSLAQSFTSIAIQSEMLAKNPKLDEGFRGTLQVVAQTARLGLAEARATVLAMRTLEPSPGNLEQVLEQLAERCTIQGVVIVSVTRLGPLCPLGPDACNTVLRVAQEAVTNALRHARCDRIDIELAIKSGSTRLIVEDNGVGFDEFEARRKGGFGLSSMQARASSLNGTLVAGRGEGGGTRITLDLPHTLDPRTTQPVAPHA